MIEISEKLRSLFTGRVHERDGSYVVEVPVSEVENDALSLGERYRVAIVETPDAASDAADTGRSRSTNDAGGQEGPTPPVDEGEVRQVVVESVGDQGDGIAKVERGYVVIVPDARPGDEPTVEIEEVQQNVAFARVIDGRSDR